MTTLVVYEAIKRLILRGTKLAFCCLYPLQTFVQIIDISVWLSESNFAAHDWTKIERRAFRNLEITCFFPFSGQRS